jgi:2-methylcitrate dehydratase
MTVAHYIPWRAIRAGHQLSDSKGASAALSTEAAIMSVHRAMRGFVGPKDIFRNPESVFRHFVRTQHDYSPFDLALTHSGDDFAIMGMHVKLGLYEHQSAGALQGVVDVLRASPELLAAGADNVASMTVVAYQVCGRQRGRDVVFALRGETEREGSNREKRTKEREIAEIQQRKVHV